MKPSGFEFVAVQTEARQESPHGKFFVVGLNFAVSRAAGFFRESNERGAKLNCGFDFAGVKRRVENAKLNRAFGEESVQVDDCVTAGVVMVIVIAVVAVPNSFQLVDSGGLFLIEFAQKSFVGRTAKISAAFVNFQGVVKNFFA